MIQTGFFACSQTGCARQIRIFRIDYAVARAGGWRERCTLSVAPGAHWLLQTSTAFDYARAIRRCIAHNCGCCCNRIALLAAREKRRLSGTHLLVLGFVGAHKAVDRVDARLPTAHAETFVGPSNARLVLLGALAQRLFRNARLVFFNIDAALALANRATNLLRALHNCVLHRSATSHFANAATVSSERDTGRPLVLRRLSLLELETHLKAARRRWQKKRSHTVRSLLPYSIAQRFIAAACSCVQRGSLARWQQSRPSSASLIAPTRLAEALVDRALQIALARVYAPIFDVGQFCCGQQAA